MKMNTAKGCWLRRSLCVWITALSLCSAQETRIRADQPQVIKIRINTGPWRKPAQRNVIKNPVRSIPVPAVTEPPPQSPDAKKHSNAAQGPIANLQSKWIVHRARIAPQNPQPPPLNTNVRSPPVRTPTKTNVPSTWTPQVKTRPSRINVPALPRTFDLRGPQKLYLDLNKPAQVVTTTTTTPPPPTTVKPTALQLPQYTRPKPRIILAPTIPPRPMSPIDRGFNAFGTNYRSPFGVARSPMFPPMDNDMLQNLFPEDQGQQGRGQQGRGPQGPFKQATPAPPPPTTPPPTPRPLPPQATPDAQFNQRPFGMNTYQQNPGQNPNLGYRDTFLAELPSIDNTFPMSMDRLAWLREQTMNPWLFGRMRPSMPYSMFGARSGFGQVPNGLGFAPPNPAPRPSPTAAPSQAQQNTNGPLPVTQSRFNPVVNGPPGGQSQRRPFEVQYPANAQNVPEPSTQQTPPALGFPGFPNFSNVNNSPSGNTTLSPTDRYRQQMMSFQFIRMSFYERSCNQGAYNRHTTGEPMSCSCYPSSECESQLFMYISPKTERECGFNKTRYICCCEEPRSPG